MKKQISPAARQISPEIRRRVAEKVGVHPATLYQAITGKSAGFSPQECVRIERESNREIRRWDLRPRDWWLIWPEIRNRKGAPQIPNGEVAAESQ